MKRQSIDRFLGFLKSPKQVLRMLAPAGKRSHAGQYTHILRSAHKKAASWDTLPSIERERSIKAIVQRVVIYPNEAAVSIRKDALFQQLTGRTKADAVAEAETFSLQCAFHQIPRGKSVRLVLGDTQAAPAASTLAVLKAIVRARAWREEIIAGNATGIRDLARLHSLNHSYVKRIYPFAAFSPASIEAILNREVPLGLSLDSLVRRIPLIWKGQNAMFTGAAKI